MLRKFIAAVVLVSGVGWAGSPAKAASVLWDYSPGTLNASGNPVYNNQTSRQRFYEEVVFEQDVFISSMAIFGGSDKGSLGYGVNIRIYSDVFNAPGSILHNLNRQITTIESAGTALDTSGTERDVSKFEADLVDPLSILAGTYWFGMSGSNLWQMGLHINAPDDSRMFQFSGTTSQGFTHTGVGDMAFMCISSDLI